MQQSKPLSIETGRARPARPRRGAGARSPPRACAIPTCRSSTATGRGRPPMALGHEAAGVVEEIGPGVDDLAGRRSRRHGVRAELRPLPALRRRAARRCASPARSRTAPARCCPARGGCTATAPTSTIISACSAFAEYATVSRRSLVKIDRELPLDEAALFGCAVLTGRRRGDQHRQGAGRARASRWSASAASA